MVAWIGGAILTSRRWNLREGCKSDEDRSQSGPIAMASLYGILTLDGKA